MKLCTLIFAAISLLLLSCGRHECNNINPIFNKYSPSSSEYKKELISQLQDIDADQIFYRFAGYAEENGKEYLNFNIQGEEICAKGLLEVKSWDERIANIKRVKGNSYQGAEFRGLSFTIEGNDLIYQGFDKIID